MLNIFYFTDGSTLYSCRTDDEMVATETRVGIGILYLSISSSQMRGRQNSILVILISVESSRAKTEATKSCDIYNNVIKHPDSYDLPAIPSKNQGIYTPGSSFFILSSLSLSSLLVPGRRFYRR